MKFIKLIFIYRKYASDWYFNKRDFKIKVKKRSNSEFSNNVVFYYNNISNFILSNLMICI